MSLANQRKKEPDVVRQKLLDCAAQILVDRGLANLTVQAVAEAAGVTKGGLLHHFASKQKLTEALFAEQLRILDGEIDAAMSADPVAHGRFTRAYVRSTLRVEQTGPCPCAALSVSTLIDPALRQAWGDWYKERLNRHRETDGDLALQLVRYAADGVWLEDLMAQDGESPIDRQALLSKMIDLTRKR
ncbi:TetR/AcrR family transcriptional regulator [Nannocystis punicea]|uniref:TetR/AcrR family transcriptional regulator n=1 Tax=Nannocystis punicea TaxID=2995304 RepID=A0ABY7GZP9_9BACT|nr:TetR/AcrR family transcriptional regulator [Nannocystis poenicansa]WAS92466.1 TetR/AcrR family transcriptional regulator [Nannocystis poenicansa]